MSTNTPDKKKSNLPMILSIVIVALLFLGFGSLIIFGTLNKSSDSQNTADQGDFTSISIAGPDSMGSGGIIFGRDATALSPGGVAAGDPLRSAEAAELEETTRVIVYVDYRCPHCAAFEQANSQVLKEALESATASVEVRPLTFMNRYSAGSAYSSRAANLFVCVAENEPENAWLIHNVLLNPAIQPQGEGPGHDDQTLAEIYSSATGSNNAAVAACVKDGSYLAFIDAVNDWTFENPVLGAADPLLKVEGTPLVIVGGERYTGDIESSTEFKSFLSAQGVKFD